MRDFHIFWMQYGMDHYLFLHLIAFIIQKYSVLNDNKEPLLRRPNTKCVIARAQLLGVASHVPPTQTLHQGRARPEPCEAGIVLFSMHPCPLPFWYLGHGSQSTEDAPAAGGDGEAELPGEGSRL